MSLDSTNPRTWGNCISLADLPEVTGACEWLPTDDPMACDRDAQTWAWLPQGGWHPTCFVHRDVITALQHEWDDAEDQEFER